MRPEHLREDLKVASERLLRYPTLCYVCLSLGPVHSISCAAEVALFRTEAKVKGFSVHVASGNIGVVSRRSVDQDALCWHRIVYELLCGSDRRPQIEVEVRESLLDLWNSFMHARSEWLECSTPVVRTLAPKYDVFAMTLRPRKYPPGDAVATARLDDIGDVSFAQAVVQAIDSIHSSEVSRAVVSLPETIGEESALRIKQDARVAIAYALVERGVVGAFNLHGKAIVFRPSLDHVMVGISKLITSHHVASDDSSTDPKSAFQDPIYADCGHEDGIDAFRLKMIHWSQPLLIKHCSFIGLCITKDDDGASYDSVAFLPKGFGSEGQEAEVSRITNKYCSVLFTALTTTYTPVWPTEGQRAPQLKIAENNSTLPACYVDSIRRTIRSMHDQLGLSFASTSIPSSSEMFALVRQFMASERGISAGYEARRGSPCIDIFADEPVLWRKVHARLDEFIGKSGAGRKAITVQILTGEKAHNNLRSKIIQKVKEHHLSCDQEPFTLPDGRSGLRIVVRPSKSVNVARQQELRRRESSPTPPVLPIPRVLPYPAPPPQDASRYMSGNSMAALQPPYRSENAIPRTINMSAHALYNLVAPNQETLPVGWEYRVASSAGSANSSSSEQGVVLLNHVTRKAYAGVRTPRDVHDALALDGGEVAYAQLVASAQPVAPFFSPQLR